MISKKVLEKEYQNKSIAEIARKYKLATSTVQSWFKKYAIKTRSISEGVYLKHNPKGDPFSFRKPKNIQESFLSGLGVGLFWGEGTKAKSTSIRLGNTDPDLIRQFVRFLDTILGIPKNKLKFSLQIFSDMNPIAAQQFWIKYLKVSDSQFTKTTITKSRGLGTYKTKTKYGVLIVYFHNKKARDFMIGMLESLRCY